MVCWFCRRFPGILQEIVILDLSLLSHGPIGSESRVMAPKFIFGGLFRGTDEEKASYDMKISCEMCMMKKENSCVNQVIICCIL